jgi:hypothetical protein
LEGFQYIPSLDQYKKFVLDVPVFRVATHTGPLVAIDTTAEVSSVLPFNEENHVIPSYEYPKIFGPIPPAAHKDPFQARAIHWEVAFGNRELPLDEPVQLIPSVEYAIV